MLSNVYEFMNKNTYPPLTLRFHRAVLCQWGFFSSNNASGSRTSHKTNYKPLPPLNPHCKAL